MEIVNEIITLQCVSLSSLCADMSQIYFFKESRLIVDIYCIFLVHLKYIPANVFLLILIYIE